MTKSDQTRIIFEDDAIRVLWQPGGSDHLVIAFGNLQMLADGTRFFADTPLKALGICAIGIMAKQAHWFPAAPLHAALPAIRDKIGRHRRAVIAFGSSMGGYGALKHARLLGATHVISCEPQWSLDPAECEITPGWKAYFRPEMAGMGISRDDIAGKVFLLRDPWQPRDDWHARRIAAVDPQARLIPVYGAGHHVMKVLSGTANLGAILTTCLTGDRAEMTRVCRMAGRHSPIRRSQILRRAISRHPDLAIPQVRLLGQREIAAHFRHYRRLLGVIPANPGPVQPGARMVLAHGPARRILVYDAARDRIARAKPPLGIGQLALQAELRNGKLRLFCSADDLRLPIRLNPQGQLELGVEGGRASRFFIDGDPGRSFGLRGNGRFLGIDEAGQTVLRDQPPRRPPFALTWLTPGQAAPADDPTDDPKDDPAD